MEFFLADIFFGLIGWIYLLIKFRNITKMRAIIKADYGDQYSSVGRDIVSNTLLIIFALAIIVLMFSYLISYFFKIG